jgi:hypothetical protein
MKYLKMGFIRKMMYKGLEGKDGNIWEYACRWFMAWGIGAHIGILFLLLHAMM